MKIVLIVASLLSLTGVLVSAEEKKKGSPFPGELIDTPIEEREFFPPPGWKGAPDDEEIPGVEGRSVDDLLKSYGRHRLAPIIRDIRKYGKKYIETADPNFKKIFARITAGSRSAVAQAMRYEKARKSKDREGVTQARRDLETALAGVFDAKLSLHEGKVRKLEKELRELRDKVRFRKNKKKRIVRRKLEDLTEGDGAWDW